MRRIDRRRWDRRRRAAQTIGTSFALGALTALGLSWWVDERAPGPPPPSAISEAEDEALSETEKQIAALEEALATPADPAPAHDPAEPRGVERPGERGERPPAGTTGSVAHATAVDELRDRNLLLPVQGIGADELRDTFFDARGTRAHEAIDIMAPRHTPVRAVENGRVARLFTSAGGGGLTIYQFDPSGRFCYYYAHLERYASGLTEGQAVRRGQVIGYVGSTGNASPDAPHLHFAIFRVTSERQWWKGEPINPYAVLTPAHQGTPQLVD